MQPASPDFWAGFFVLVMFTGKLPYKGAVPFLLLFVLTVATPNQNTFP
jgi:hypothetical protein